MKRFKNFIAEMNVSAGMGVRGFGDVSGTPATTDDVENSHIGRVVQGANEQGEYVKGYMDDHNNLHTNGTSILDEPEDDNWWAKAGARGSALTALGAPQRSKNKLDEENGVGGGAIAGVGVPSPNPNAPANFADAPVSRKAQIRHTQQNNQQGERRTFIIDMLRRAFPNMVGTNGRNL